MKIVVNAMNKYFKIQHVFELLFSLSILFCCSWMWSIIKPSKRIETLNKNEISAILIDLRWVITFTIIIIIIQSMASMMLRVSKVVVKPPVNKLKKGSGGDL